MSDQQINSWMNDWEGQSVAVHWPLNSRDCDCWLGLALCVWLTSQYPDGSRGFLITRLSESGKYTQRADADVTLLEEASSHDSSHCSLSWRKSPHSTIFMATSLIYIYNNILYNNFFQLFYFRMICQTWWNFVVWKATRITMVMADRPRTAEYASILISRPHFESDNDKILFVPYGGENITSQLNEMIRV